MKRGGPLKRRTELKAKKLMPRGEGPKRTANKPKRSKSSHAKTNAGLDALKAQARKRDQDTCVKCGVIVAPGQGNVHHRRNRGQGGSSAANVISNLITLCGTPSSGCHGDVTLRPWQYGARANGWALSTNSGEDPASAPVLVAWLGWAYPLADGTWQVIDEIGQVAS